MTYTGNSVSAHYSLPPLYHLINTVSYNTSMKVRVCNAGCSASVSSGGGSTLDYLSPQKPLG